eukprot:m.143582 g.143582  ORF g.143582 m.143582 type:complete len:762 (+) comp14989_c0_seq6:50-2335(+)
MASIFITAMKFLGIALLLVLVRAEDPAEPEIRSQDGNLMLSVQSDNNVLIERRVLDNNGDIIANTSDVLLTNTQLNNMLAPLIESLSTAQAQLVQDALTQTSQAQVLINQSSRIVSLQNDLASERARALLAESALSAAINTANVSLNTEASLAAVAELDISNSVLTESSRAINAENTLSTGVGTLAVAILTETSRAMVAEAGLGAGLGTEISRAVVVEGQLSSAVGVQVSRATSSEQTLTSAINTAIASIAREASRAVVQETALSAALVTGATQSSTAVQSVANALTSEASRAVLIETQLSTSIASESSRAQGVEGTLTATATAAVASVAQEASRAVSQELLIAASVGAELTRALAAEQAVSSAVVMVAASTTREASRAIVQETVLSTAVVAEVTRASSAESAMSTALAANVAARGTNDNAISTAIANEVTRATAAELSVGNTASAGRSADVTRASTAESAISTAVATELTRATNAENAISTAVATEVNRATGAQGTINTNINAEITRAQTIEGTLANFVAATFLPTFISGIRLWVSPESANVATAINGASLTSWNDLSGNSYNLATGNAPRVQATGGSLINGRRTVLFTTTDGTKSATSQFLYTTQSFSGSAFSAMIVAKIQAAGSMRVFGGVSNNWLLGWHGGSMNNYYFAGASATVFNAGVVAADLNPYLFLGTSSGSGGTSILYRNGVLLGSGTSSTWGTAGPTGVCLGGYNCGTTMTANAEFSTVAVAEVIIYNVELTFIQRQALENYLRAKYNLW